MSRRPSGDPRAPLDGEEKVHRIGKVAELASVTTRTLRYWQQIGLLNPNGPGGSAERLYTSADVIRAIRIRELQELLGFSLAEIRVVLETDDLLDRLRAAHFAGALPESQRPMLAAAMEANDALLTRLNETISRISLFRDDRVIRAERMRILFGELERQLASADRRKSVSPRWGDDEIDFQMKSNSK